MEWTQVRAECDIKDLETLTAIMSMTENSLMIEDYSDVSEGVNAIYGELLDEELLKKDKNMAAVSVFIPKEKNLSEALESMRDLIADSGIKAEITTCGLDEKDWADSWKKYYKPINIGKKLVIVPMWEDYSPGSDKVTVRMDPGMAFGTGTHETTALCAELLEKYMIPGRRVLDVGTGSGILAIICSKLGASEVDALDIDESAVKVAKENCKANGVANISCRQSDLIANAQGQYSFICANIVADIVIRMSGDVGKYLEEDGIVILSGIINSQAERVEKAFGEKGFRLLEKTEKNDWNAFVFGKTPSQSVQ